MIRTREVRIGVALRLLIGAVGVVAVASGLALAAVTARSAWPRASPAWLAAAFFVVVAVAGAALVRSAVRGRLAVRAQGRARAPRGR